MKFFLRLALREIWGQRRTSFIIVFNLVLGLTGLLTVSLFRGSVETSIEQSSKEHLGADLVLSGRRDLESTEKEALQSLLPAGSEVSFAKELYTSVATGQQARLVHLRAHQSNYPFYGSLEKQQGSESLLEIHEGEGGAWIYPELKAQLGLKVGDQLKLGEVQVPILGVVEADVVSAASGLALAPSVYISLSTLEASGLVQPGSLVRYSRLLKLPADLDVEQVKRDIEGGISAHDIRISTHKEASERSNQALLYLTDYLSLVSLVALVLSVLGSTYILRTYLQRRAVTFGLFKSLGLHGVQVQKIFFIQMGLLGGVAGVLALLLSWAVSALLRTALSHILGSSFVWNVSLGQILLLLLMSFLVILLLTWPYSDRIRRLKVTQLFQESWETHFAVSFRSVMLWLPAFAALMALTLYLSSSVKVSALFLVLLVVAFSALVILGFLIFFAASRWWSRDWPWNQALRFLDRERYSTLAAFSSLSLGVALIVMTFQLERGLVREISLPSQHERPGLFMFDIQDEQLEPFEQFLADRGVEPLHLAPMIRARLKTVNGEGFSRDLGEGAFETREEDRSRRMRNRGFNLTYQGALQSSQSLTKGRWEEEFSDELPAISVEQQFARRLGFNLGDILVFDVQGVDVRGKVVSFRRINWGSFQPNFFVTFQPGVLEGAPKTFVATLPEMELDPKNQLQADLVAEFPNVSTVDVKRTLDGLLGIVQSMGKSFKLMASLALFAALGVFLSILQYRFFHRSKDLILFKAVGASSKNLGRLVNYEMAWLGAGATALGIAVGLVLSLLPSAMLFDGVPVVSPSWVIWVTPILAVSSGYFLSKLWTVRLFQRSRGLEAMR